MAIQSMWQACIKDKRYETDRQMADRLVYYYSLLDLCSKQVNRGKLF